MGNRWRAFFASLCLACQGVKAGPAVLAAIGAGLRVRFYCFWVQRNGREKLFCMISQLPKAYGTGGLSMCEQMAAGILITAPLGAVLMDKTYRRLLRRNADSDTFGE